MEYRIVRSILFVVPGREFSGGNNYQVHGRAAQAAVLQAVGF